jgi:hypothetical protein
VTDSLHQDRLDVGQAPIEVFHADRHFDFSRVCVMTTMERRLAGFRKDAGGALTFVRGLPAAIPACSGGRCPRRPVSPPKPAGDVLRLGLAA